MKFSFNKEAIFGSEFDRLQKKLLKLEGKKAQIEADPMHSKDDLVRINLQIDEIQAKLKELKK